MSNVTVYLFLLYGLFLTGCKSNNAIDASIYIKHIEVLDPETGFIGKRHVAIEGSIIKKISSEEFRVPKEALIIEGRGKYLIPGLWDAHVHFDYIPDLAPSMFDLFLLHGVTSVRDTGGRLAEVAKWKKKAQDDPTMAPRVMIAGPLVDGAPSVYDGSSHSRPPLGVETGSVEEARLKVQELADAGVDLIKAYEMLTPEQLAAVTDEARKHGLKVTGHVPLSMDVIQASKAGLNSIEHMRNLEMSCVEDIDDQRQVRQNMLQAGASDEGGILRSRIHAAQRAYALDNQSDQAKDRVLTALKENDVWQIPTLSIMTAMTKRQFLREDYQATFDLIPEEIGKGWKERSKAVGDSDVSPLMKEYTSWFFDMTKRIHDKKIPIMAGTDCPIFFLTPGYSLHEELSLLVEAGLTPLEAINAATVRPAEYFNFDDHLGRIEEGYEADLLILDANPLENIRWTVDISSVIKSGKLYGLKELEEIKDRLRRH